MMAQPKIGPRGVTIDDVQDVATNGLRQTGAATYKSVSQPKPPAFNPELLAAMMAGRPAETYGQKYGGFPTQSMLNDAALGYAYNWRDVADLANEQVATLSAPIESQLGDVYDSATGYDAFAAEIAKGRTPVGNLFKPKSQNVIGDFANAKAEADRQAAVAKYKSDADAQAVADYNRLVSPYENLASTIQTTPISQLARQALTNIYGVDPNVARATFTEQTDLDYAKLQRDAELAAQGIDFSMSEGEMIYNTQGLEAYNAYRDQKTYEAMYGTPAEQAKAQQDLIDSQNAPIDADILSNYGIAPKEVTNADADTVRTLFMDPDFVAKWIMPSFELLDANNGNPTVTTADIAGTQAQAYLKENPNDILRAKTLAAIIAEFDFYAR